MYWNILSAILAFATAGAVLWLGWQMYLFGRRKIWRLRTRRRGIAVVTFNSPIAFGGDNTPFGHFMDKLDYVMKIRPRALILRVNSPGGSVGAIQEMHGKIQEVRAKGIPVVALTESVAASGGLYLCMAASRVVASPGGIMGSIGVIMRKPDLSGAYEFLRIRQERIVTGKYKGALSAVDRPWDENDRTLLQGVVQSAFGQFVNAIAAARGLEPSAILPFADGRIFTGEQAYELGLVDGIGCFRQAVLEACALGDIEPGRELLRPIGTHKPWLQRALGLSADSILGQLETRVQLGMDSGPQWILPGF